MEQATLNGPVLVRGFIKGLSRGSHGFHIHTKGQLGNKCKDAGSHFNPFKARFFFCICEILIFVHQKAVSLCCGIFKYLDETQQLKIRLRMPLNSINGPSFF